MAHYCPKRQQRVFLDNCKLLCPRDYKERLVIDGEGRLNCGFMSEAEKRIEKREKGLTSGTLLA